MAGPLWPRTRRGSTDEALIKSVYEEHGHALLAYATRLTGDRAAAEDVVQETLIRAWRHPGAGQRKGLGARLAAHGGPQHHHRPLPGQGRPARGGIRSLVRSPGGGGPR
ncbi:sigma factor, partial [Streptomyces avidinii]